MGIDFHALRTAITDATREAFTSVQKAHPNEQFYAFALYSDDGAMTVCPASNTQEGLTRRVKHYAKYTPPPRIEYLRWATAEWAYEADGGEHYTELHNAINAPDAHTGFGFDRFKGNLFATMVFALRDLDEEEFFGKGAERKKITLFCSVSDSPSAPWFEYESARVLNPTAVFREFSKQWRIENGHALAVHRRKPFRDRSASWFDQYLERWWCGPKKSGF